MKKIIQNYLLAIILIFSSFGTNAVLLTETYESTVLETYNSPFQIGDTFSWTVSFDNESQRTVTYGDGQNKIAEFGQGDDYVYSAFCTDSYFTSPNAEWCPNGGSSNWDYLADAVFDLSEFYLPHEEAGLTGITSYLNYRQFYTHRSYRMHHTTGIDKVEYQADDLLFKLDYFGVNTKDYAATYYLGEFDFNKNTYSLETGAIYFDSELISVRPANVSEPSTLALMGLGLAGLGFSRRIKKNKRGR